MTGFDRYTKEIERFEKSKLYTSKYAEIVHWLYQQVNREAVYSHHIEQAFQLKGAQVRAIIRHARRKGHPIISHGKGYRIVTDYDKLMDACEHLKERAYSLLFTYSRIRKFARTNPQMNFLEKLKDT